VRVNLPRPRTSEMRFSTESIALVSELHAYLEDGEQSD
jgi:hypothetical protein